MSILKNDDVRLKIFFSNAIWVLLFLLFCRLVASYFIPLNDTTEARYGEIARKMLETGDWITLQHDYGLPFWAKPPLSTWMSALSMKCFGVNEFAARLPGLLFSLGILWLIWDLAKKQSGQLVATTAVLVLAGSLYFFLDAGAVMTDPALIFCTTLAFVAFWHALVYQQRLWAYIFFVALGLGLLAKGPIALVLVGLSIFFWVLWRNEWVNLWYRLPWIKGTLILLVIALPWYVMAEIKTPGFLNYFIVGEHLSRFLTPGWTGDKYGMAHLEPKGMIWVYAVAGIFPWSVWGAGKLLKSWKLMPSLCRDDDGWMSYLLICMLSPLVFFTFASNIIYPYVFPALPAFALFFAELLQRMDLTLSKSKWILFSAMLCGLFFLAATLFFEVKPNWVAKTQKPLITAWKNQHPAKDSVLIYWDYGTWFSAQFYAAGKVRATKDLSQLCRFFASQKDNYLVIDANELAQIPSELSSKWTKIKTVVYKEKNVLLVRSPVLDQC